ncbi:MetQ/NlpA family ABC transporter substrate-binding protein [Streptomyces sp. CAI-21]|jgi:D-methionine transport system substrate-binding protein|uniref:Lipoprotein n=1 Tax=Streptomyces albidoflavus TaxID=1886 RepID=A0AB37X745_9ACTN|nr:MULTISPECIES: MetQ/NlpA family ABC transporter substrate-binding protein [Streptomyces]NUW08697.1 MetQ/NlpA family ABC transporter substrate-binding protein [Streptomyces sp. CAI-21]QLA59896.1 MetQ/NlpA family ABC transporter substrate-binding protein [Streptomyces violascens]AWL31274.1 MetQ/NlpA family ABC transporter substrate-binding protein [Streptomyces sp. SM17]MBK3386194.1 MetQ/NlpA family ABC transporter substrate-binding protein [Streptomyces sp. DEF147AK]MBK3387887.1 MetQ/NlpA fam
MRKTLLTAAAGALTLGLTLTACGSGSGPDDASGAEGPLVVGATPTPAGEILEYVRKNLAKDAGLDLDIKEFTDYVLPNTALQEGTLDANLYQHQPYLDEFNQSKGTELVALDEIYLPPTGVYSEKVKDIADLRKGATVAVPNDVTNEGRALNLLAEEGLIELKKGAGAAASPSDIAKNPKNITIKELDPAQLPRSLSDVDAAAINNNFALDAGLSPREDAILLEEAKDNPYNNVLAVKKGNENDPRVKKLAELLTSPEVKKFIEDTYKGSVIPATAG